MCLACPDSSLQTSFPRAVPLVLCGLVTAFVVQWLSCVWLCATPWTKYCSMPALPLPHDLPELAQTHVHWVSDAIQPSHTLSSPSPPAFNLSQHQGLVSWFFASGGQSIYLRFSFSISHSREHSGLISFRTNWFDLLAVQGTLKNLLQHHSLKASILRCSAFFTVQNSHLYMTTGKTIAFTTWTFVGKVIDLCFF